MALVKETHMWFKNVLIYQVHNMPDDKALDSILYEHRIKPCPPHSRYIYGWSEVIGETMLHAGNGYSLFVMAKEERILPNAVITQHLDEKVQSIEATEARTIRRSERNQLKEELEFTLLPQSFSILKKTWAYYDKKRQYLIVNTSSLTMGEQFTALLRKSIKEIEILPIALDVDMSGKLTQCIHQPHTLPKHFDLGDKVLLHSPDDDKKRFNCKGYELPAEEVDDLLKRGLKAIELSFSFNDRIDFTLTHQLIIKNIKCHDLLLEELKETQKMETREEEFDASFAILTHEIDQLVEEIFVSLLSLESSVTLEARKSMVLEDKKVANQN